MANKNGILYADPTVCAVEDYYLIAVPVRKKVLMHVEIGGKRFFNHSNGVRVSDTCVQMFKVPSALLNEHKEYKIYFKQIYKRLAYSVSTGEEQALTYKFKPLEKTENINICHISDTHGQRKAPFGCGSFFGDDLDLLILNGDISSSTERMSQVILPYQIASDITKGEIPVIISRGNHDLRGENAEKLDKLLPTANGKSYYTVSLGEISFLVTDCGEDKVDEHREYGGTAAYHGFREEETEFIRSVAEKDGFLNKKYRFVISHIPFPIRNTNPWGSEKAPFDIENDIYDEWTALVNESFKPQFFFGGHYHEIELIRKDSERNTRKVCCDILLGSKPEGKTDFIGACVTVNRNCCLIRFVDKNRKVSDEIVSKF